MLWMIFAAAAAAAGLAAETHSVIDDSYHHTFSAAHPVLVRIKPGDRVVTKTVDSAGFDFQRIRRTKTHGNPLTGPIFIEGAQPGDALVVHLEKIDLNRPSGYTGHSVGVSHLPPSLTPPKPRPDAVAKGYDYLLPWAIDLKKKTVRPTETESRTSLEFPAEPMLGCIGVAPQGEYSPRSGPAGYWGGNLDYRWVRQGTTMILPVFHEGGLLFFGDGHALQGDGEGVGSGVETSLDVEVRVELRKAHKLDGPRAETAEYLISIGAMPEGNLNATMPLATRDMLHWLVEERGMTVAEAHLLIGMQARYDVLTLGGSMALRIPKRFLPANGGAGLH